MRRRGQASGFTLLELAISLALVTLLLAILLPALSSARRASHREQCAQNQRRLGEAWIMYLEDHEGAFPAVPVQPAWYYGGVRVSPIDGRVFLDTQRPLSPYVSSAAWHQFCCPADAGITGETGGVGTGERTAWRSFGTSYRANALLLGDAARDRAPGAPGPAGAPRGLRRDEISTAPSRLVLQGDPIWYELRERTGRDAAWHGEAAKGNLLFLDGAVKFMEIRIPPRVGPAVYEPVLRGAEPGFARPP